MKPHASTTFAALLAAAIVVLSGCSSVTYKYVQPVAPAISGNFMEYPVVESLQPTLKWQAMPDAFKDATIESYDVAVYPAPKREMGLMDSLNAALQQQFGDPVYSKDGIKATELKVDKPLRPDTKYVWTVRVHYKKGGADAVSPWASYDAKVRKEYVLYSETATVNDACFGFRTPPAKP